MFYKTAFLISIFKEDDMGSSEEDNSLWSSSQTLLAEKADLSHVQMS